MTVLKTRHIVSKLLLNCKIKYFLFYVKNFGVLDCIYYRKIKFLKNTNSERIDNYEKEQNFSNYGGSSYDIIGSTVYSVGCYFTG